jgi:Polymerase beta, Nucleotidyltransferase
MLKEVVHAVAGSDVQAVVLFGSIARGEAGAAGDIDLAVIAPNGWAVWRWRTLTRSSRMRGVPTSASCAAANTHLPACYWPVAYRRLIENQIRAGNTTLP